MPNKDWHFSKYFCIASCNLLGFQLAWSLSACFHPTALDDIPERPIRQVFSKQATPFIERINDVD
jgi:hypothetical protein